MRIIKDLGYDRKWSRKQVNPFTMAFVYPRGHEPGIVKGGLDQVKKFIENNYIALVYYTLWCRRKHRGYADIANFDNYYMPYHGILIPNTWDRTPEQHGYKLFNEMYYRKHWVLIVYKNQNEEATRIEFRRPPRRWLHELEPFVERNILYVEEKEKERRLYNGDEVVKED